MKPTDPVVRAVLARALVARLATQSPSGRPHLDPSHFVLRGGALWLESRGGSAAVRNVAADGRVCVLVEAPAEHGQRPVLRLWGQARVRRQVGALAAYRVRGMLKYLLQAGRLADAMLHPGTAWRHGGTGHGGEAGLLIIEMLPERVEFLYGRIPSRLPV